MEDDQPTQRRPRGVLLPGPMLFFRGLGFPEEEVFSVPTRIAVAEPVRGAPRDAHACHCAQD
jgi:hypothetical protein